MSTASSHRLPDLPLYNKAQALGIFSAYSDDYHVDWMFCPSGYLRILTKYPYLAEGA